MNNKNCRLATQKYTMEPMEDIPDEEHTNHRFFDILSDELALNIFKFLDLRTLLKSLGVNSNFRRLITDPSVGLVRIYTRFHVPMNCKFVKE